MYDDKKMTKEGCNGPVDDTGKPIHRHVSDGTWWFYTETWCDEVGPFASRQEAVDAMVRYARGL